MSKFDLIVIGSGHAGIEASYIAAKMGASVLLLTANPDFIGQMSCNPAIGGVAKGNIVREIDALGGLMGALIDRARTHIRMLNVGKGSAVWGPRAQADKVAYRILARRALEACPNISILQTTAGGTRDLDYACSYAIHIPFIAVRTLYHFQKIIRQDCRNGRFCKIINVSRDYVIRIISIRHCGYN